MTYRAIIERDGERRALKLGRCHDTTAACHVAMRKCPVGWQIIDVHPI